MADDVTVTFAASIEKLLEGINGGTAAIKGFAHQVEEVTGSVGKVGAALAEAFAVEKIVEFVSRMAELGEQTERMARILGVSTTDVQQLGFMAKSTGGDAEGLALAMERLQVNLMKAQAGTGPAAQGLEALGLKAKDLIGLPLPEQMDRIADKLSHFADGGNKTAIAMELLGRAGAQMIPLLDEGSAGMEHMRNKALDAGAIIAGPTVKALDEMQKDLVTVRAAATGLAASLVGAMAPAFDSVITGITDMISGMNALITGGGLWESAVEDLRLVVSQFALEMLRLGVIAKDVFTLNWGEISTHWNNGAKLIEDDLAAHEARMLEIMRAARAKMRAGELATAHESGLPQAPSSGAPDKEAVSAAMKQIDGEISVLRQGLAQKKLIFDAGAAQFQITQNQKFALLQTAVQQEAAEEEKLLQQELRIGNLTVAERQTVENKIKELHAKTVTEMVRLDEQSIAAQQRLWEQYTSTVGSAFNSQLRGLLAGTTSWASAMKTIFADVSLKFIELLITKPVEQWIAAELAKTTATTTGAGARAAAEEAGQGASLIMTFANALKAITVDAAKTFGGIFGFLAPEMGPAAAAPAAAGSAAVMAVASSIPALDTGGYVLRSGLAMIHTGETVTRAADVAANGPGGGGHTFNFHGPFVTSTDNRSVRNFAKTISDELLRNPSLRPAY